MIKDVIINIKGTQEVDGRNDTIELTTDGRFGIKEGQYFISYSEGELLDSGDEVKTKIYIKTNDSLILQRSGTINSRMYIKKGERNTCFYSTPVGDIDIGIFGEVFNFALDDSGGEINVEYTIDSNLQVISRNTVNISIREVK